MVLWVADFWLKQEGGLWTLLTRVVSKPTEASSVAKSMSGAYAEVTFVLSKSIPRKICDVCIVICQDFHRICIVCPSTKWPKNYAKCPFQAGSYEWNFIIRLTRKTTKKMVRHHCPSWQISSWNLQNGLRRFHPRLFCIRKNRCRLHQPWQWQRWNFMGARPEIRN